MDRRGATEIPVLLELQRSAAVSDPLPTPEEALEDMRRLLEKQQDFVQTAIDNWDAISSVKLPLKKTGNGKGTSLIDFV